MRSNILYDSHTNTAKCPHVIQRLVLLIVQDCLPREVRAYIYVYLFLFIYIYIRLSFHISVTAPSVMLTRMSAITEIVIHLGAPEF